VKSYGILVLRSSNVKNSKIDFEDCVFVNCSVDEDKYVQPNDILICVRNGSSALIGKSCVIDKPYNATFGACMSILRGDKKGYVAHVFASDIVQSQIRNRSSATINQITKRDFEDIVIPIPAEETEQRRIAEALSDTDALLAAMGKLIAKKRAIKQGAMQELLTGKRRLPGFEREWVERTVDYYGTFTSGNGFPLVYQGEKAGDYPFYKVSDFSNAGNENIMRRANHYISWAIATMLNCNIIPDGSIVFAKIGAAIFLERKRQNQGDCCIDNNMMAFTANDEGDSKYIMYLFQTIKFGDLVTATALPSLSGKQVGAILKQFPPTEAEQTAIAEILSDMDAEIDALTAKLNKLRNIKQGMMSELLTGRIRLTEQEAETSPEAKHKVKIIKLPAAKKIAAKKQIKSTAVKKTAADAKEAYRDAVIMVALVNAFGTEEHPFTAFDCQKFPYLFHRHVEGAAKGYTKQAAGPYNADLKYRTARPIALKKNYVREHVGNYKGFVVSDDAQEALDYFAQWHGEEPLKWLEQFRRIKDRRDELELLTTVDMAMVELREAGNPISLLTVKKIIQSSKAWRAKLKREIFSDANIIRAIRWSNDLFGTEGPPQ
jgi:type I restriction enzyme S subunit